MAKLVSERQNSPTLPGAIHNRMAFHSFIVASRPQNINAIQKSTISGAPGCVTSCSATIAIYEFEINNASGA